MGQKSLKTENISCTGRSELTTETDSAETTQQGLLWSRPGGSRGPGAAGREPQAEPLPLIMTIYNLPFRTSDSLVSSRVVSA